MTICYDVFWSSSPWALIIYTTYTSSMLPHPSTGNRSLALLYDTKSKITFQLANKLSSWLMLHFDFLHKKSISENSAKIITKLTKWIYFQISEVHKQMILQH